MCHYCITEILDIRFYEFKYEDIDNISEKTQDNKRLVLGL